MTTHARYGRAGAKFAAGDIDLLVDTIRVAMLDNTHTPNLDTHEFWSAVSADEVTGTGYTAEGAVLASIAAGTYDSTNNQTPFTAADTVWDATGGALTGRYAVVYKDTGTPSTSPLISLVDFEADVTATNDLFTIDWHNTDGFVKL